MDDEKWRYATEAILLTPAMLLEAKERGSAEVLSEYLEDVVSRMEEGVAKIRKQVRREQLPFLEEAEDILSSFDRNGWCEWRDEDARTGAIRQIASGLIRRDLRFVYDPEWNHGFGEKDIEEKFGKGDQT